MTSRQSLMVRTVAAKEFRANLSKVLLDLHRDKGYVVIQRAGVPMAALLDIEEFEDYLAARDPGVRSAIAEVNREYSEGKEFPAEEILPRLAAKRGQKKAARNKRR